MIEFRTNGKWGMLILLAIAVVFTLNTALPTAEAAPGDIYYVAPDGNDSNPGTEAQPWKTISKVNYSTAYNPGEQSYLREGEFGGVCLILGALVQKETRLLMGLMAVETSLSLLCYGL